MCVIVSGWGSEPGEPRAVQRRRGRQGGGGKSGRIRMRERVICGGVYDKDSKMRPNAQNSYAVFPG